MYAEEGGSKMAPVLRAVNQIAAALEPEYPHILFSTLAYEFAKATPNTTRPRHNVVIRLCADGCDGGIAISGQANICRANFLDWFGILGDRDRTGGLHVWNYAANFESYLQQYPNYWAMIDDIKWFAVSRQDRLQRLSLAGLLTPMGVLLQANNASGLFNQVHLHRLLLCCITCIRFDALVRRGCPWLPEERWPS